MADYLPGEDISTGRLFRLYRRAITGKWGVTDDLARKAITQLESVLDSQGAEPGLKVAAAKTLMAATKLELDEIKLNLDIERAEKGDGPTQKIIVEYYDRPIDPEGDVSEAASESDQGQD